jgi:DNA-binding NtrC family response regulator
VELQSLKQRFGIIGNSVALNHALSIAQQVSPTDLSVLITGESGVGKEIFSQIIHQLSPRKHNNFIAVNCGAIPEGTIDSELFGHEKGSFTGAVDNRKGYFETVNGGTIFLDEIAEMPLGTQARLLRVLETKEYIKVGSSKVLKTDVRVIAATNVNLLEQIQIGKFREDLYYRLNTVPIKVPSLRERSEDIYTLFRKFTIDFSEKIRRQPIQLNDEAKHILTTYSWPGNIRELKNLAESLTVLAKDKVVGAEELKLYLPNSTATLPMILPRNQTSNTGDYTDRDIMYKVLFDMKNDLTDLKKIVYGMMNGNPVSNEINTIPNNNLASIHSNDSNNTYVIDNKQNKPIEIEESLSIIEKEKELILKALKKHRGRRRDASNDLGISERTLYRKIKEYNIPE